MMDFEAAAQRLARDQKNHRGRRKPMVVSEQAKRQADYQKKQRAKLQAEKQRNRRLLEHQNHYMTRCNRSLHVRSLVEQQQQQQQQEQERQQLVLQATSIHGTGDKLSLPPSVLQKLTAEMGNATGSPWTFRIGVLNPDYTFPASPLVQTLKPPLDLDAMTMMMDSDNDNDDSDDDNDDNNDKAAYMDELSHKYLAYTHCTVVEFTQDEGSVGIPHPIAKALLDPDNRPAAHHSFGRQPIPTTRTVDPSKVSMTTEDGDDTGKEDDDKDKDDDMDMDMDATTTTTDAEKAAKASPDATNEGDGTPGHVAYGAFDIPSAPLEITMVQLPKGTGCTLVPTPTAIQHGFYGLQDVKLVLEQSLIRTRATLSTGDVVSTWHRGVRFDLTVSHVIPSAFGAVTCINTDIEVEIGAVEKTKPSEKNGASVIATATTTTTATATATATPTWTESTVGQRLGTGRTLGSSASTPDATASSAPLSSSTDPTTTLSPCDPSLLPEPPVEQKEHVVQVQIRYSGGNGKRRFDVTHATVQNLLDYAASVLQLTTDQFQLVTRFPRRVLSVDMTAMTTTSSTTTTTLAETGIAAGQELFLVEMI